jgi:hypothetical protein
MLLNSCVLAAVIPAKSERTLIPGQKASPRTLVKTTTSQLVSQGPRPHCSVLVDPPRKTTQVSSGIRIANAQRLQSGCSALKEAPGCVQEGRRLSLIPRATEANEWHIHLRVLYIIREGGPGVRVRTSEQAKRKSTNRPLAFKVISRSRIDEHYETSHPAKWSEYQLKLESKRPSAAINTDFFDVNKITSHFRRVQDSSVKNKVSRNVSDFIKSLYEKDEAYAADDPDVCSVRILERRDSDSDEGSADEDHEGYVN